MHELIARLLDKPPPSLLALSIVQFTGPNRLARHRDLIAALTPPPPMFSSRPQIRVVGLEAGGAPDFPNRQMMKRQPPAITSTYALFEKSEQRLDVDPQRQLETHAA